MQAVSPKWLSDLNPAQREAVTCGDGPLLVVAGAGTGKTLTLVSRVAYLVSQGVPPDRILLLTFTRRAADEMLRRAASLVSGEPSLAKRVWGGTFHATANRLLRIYARQAGLSPDFTILDRSDAEDFLNVVRNDLSFSSRDRRFPQKATCLAIYSRRVNGAGSLEDVVKRDFPWCLTWQEELKQLFREYVLRKQRQGLLDYDDLLLYWYHLVQDESVARDIGSRFDHILVDEYQDTNPVQAGILRGMRRQNNNLTAVGDDAQSIYSFRSASVRNMLDFPAEFPGARIVTLEQNYRSLQPVLDTTNRVIARARERYSKELWSERKGGQRPQLITCAGESEQDETVIRNVLQHREQGIALRKQAVLFRTASHSDSLELALSSRNIPFHKYGGLRFLEMAHIKDLIGFLRVMENPHDQVAWFRVLQLLSGVGPVTAAAAFEHMRLSGGDPSSLAGFAAPAAAVDDIRGLADLVRDLKGMESDGPSGQIERIERFYLPVMERVYENPAPRANDIKHLGELARKYGSRRQFLDELVLDPPLSTGDLAGPPYKDEDWLVLSTIHSAKGLEWDVVYLIHAADGNLPSDMATGSEQEIEEELRLAYVAMTRARDFLYVLWPLRYYHKSAGISDNHSYAQCSRFFTSEVTATMDCVVAGDGRGGADVPGASAPLRLNISDRIREMWE
ncbi:MAG: ATP-dependent helicase [Chloroflexi bacterium]|nr:ATP-dependent helicase [Chloroflexota bacterium]